MCANLKLYTDADKFIFINTWKSCLEQTQKQPIVTANWTLWTLHLLYKYPIDHGKIMSKIDKKWHTILICKIYYVILVQQQTLLIIILKLQFSPGLTISFPTASSPSCPFTNS